MAAPDVKKQGVDGRVKGHDGVGGWVMGYDGSYQSERATSTFEPIDEGRMTVEIAVCA